LVKKIKIMGGAVVLNWFCFRAHILHWTSNTKTISCIVLFMV